MKRLLNIIAIGLVTLVARAQSDIAALEYYIDTDPGEGNASAISITQGQQIDIQHSIDVSGLALSTGVHLLVVRAQNMDGDWSFYEARNFLISDAVGNSMPPVEDIVELEYFIDVDPGVGNGSDITISSGSTVDLNYSVDIPSLGLDPGYHKIGIRARNAAGAWSMFEMRKFLITEAAGNPEPPISDIVAAEYFIDEDPGHGMGESLPVSTGLQVDTDHAVMDDLNEGWHTLHVRAQNSEGHWGFSEKRRFYVKEASDEVTEISDVVKIEYFFNEDPGIDQGIEMNVGPAQEIDIASLLIDSQETLPVGTNIFGLRAQNAEGNWGFTEIREFEVEDDCTQPVADFETALACADESVTFTSISTNLQPDASYTWYLNGSELMDETESAFSTVFENPGEYTTSLVINQGQICKDSVGAAFTIKEKPIVVFSADPVYLGDPTVYEVDTFYVDPLATWDWDFQTDSSVDDYTVGDNSFTFSSVGSYLTTLSVTDGLGCNATYSREVEVLEETVSVDILDSEISILDTFDNSEVLNGSDPIALGILDQNESVTRVFSIQNSGTDALAINSIMSSNSLFSVSDVPTEVSPSGSDDITISFLSLDAGQYSTSIIIESNDADESVFIMNLSIEVEAKQTPELVFDVGDKTYGDVDFTLELDSNSDGTITYMSSDQSVISISGDVASIQGTGSCTIAANQESTDEYLSGEVVVNVEVQKKKLFVFAGYQSKKYGEENPELTLTYSGFIDGGAVNDLDTQPTASTDCNELSDVGIYTIEISVGSDEHYDIEVIDGELEVLKTELFARASNTSKVYGNPTPELTIGYEGFVNDESFEVLDVIPTTTTEVNPMSPAGTYPIQLSAGSDKNYEVITIDGKIEVTKARLTATANNQTRIQGFENEEFTIDYQGFVNGDGPESIVEPSVFTTATITSPIGEYEIYLNGGSADNYYLELVNGVLTITPSDVLSLSASDLGFNIFPNPAHDFLSIANEQQIEKVWILDLNGKEILEIENGFDAIDVRDLPKGVYLVSVKTKDQIFNERIIKRL